VFRFVVAVVGARRRFDVHAFRIGAWRWCRLRSGRAAGSQGFLQWRVAAAAATAAAAAAAAFDRYHCATGHVEQRADLLALLKNKLNAITTISCNVFTPTRKALDFEHASQ